MEQLITAVRSFITISPGHRRRSLRDFQGLAGHISWALNVYPLLRPALCNIYAKIAGKRDRYAAVYVNAAVVRDLEWLLAHLRRLPVVNFLKALSWSPADLSSSDPAAEFAMTDASAWGMGIYFPWRHIGLYARRPDDAPSVKIFFHEALAICSAVHRLTRWRAAGRLITRLAVLTDSEDAVWLFNSLSATPTMNPILTSSVDILIDCHTQLRVDHIPGEFNTVADALSRGLLQTALDIDPDMVILPFTPPRDALGGLRE